MNTGQANGIVATSLLVTGGLVVVRDVSQGTPPPLRFFIGLTVSGIGLATVAQLGAPELAASLALLVVTTSALVYGGPAWDAITAATDQTAPRPTTHQRPRYS